MPKDDPMTPQRLHRILDKLAAHAVYSDIPLTGKEVDELRAHAAQLERNGEMLESVLATLRETLYGKDHTVLGNDHCIKYRARSIELWHKDPNFDVVKAAQEIQELQEKSHNELVNLSHKVLPKPLEAT